MESEFIGQVSSQDAPECLGKCQSTDQCQWFTFKPSLPTCFLYKNCSMLSEESCPNCISGEVTCDPNQCYIKGMCQVVPDVLLQSSGTNKANLPLLKGVLDQDVIAGSVDECSKMCQSNSDDCKWITYDSSNNICFQFQNCPSLDESCNTCNTSQIECFPNKPDSMSKQASTIAFYFYNKLILYSKALHYRW